MTIFASKIRASKCIKDACVELEKEMGALTVVIESSDVLP